MIIFKVWKAFSKVRLQVGDGMYINKLFGITKNWRETNSLQRKRQVALEIDPYAVAWKLKNINRIAPVVVGHIPREISRAICFFLEKGGTVTGKVFEERCRPSPIPKGGLEILLQTKISIADGKRKYLDRLKCIISENYDPSSETEMLSFREGKELEEEKQRQEEMIDFEQVIVFEDDDDEVEDVGDTPESKT